MKNTKNILFLAAVLIIIISIVLIGQNKSRMINNNAPVLLAGSNSDIALEKEKIYPRARELVNPQGYIDINTITISENIGKKVILIDFWTYSCINCQRTIPYLNSWYEKYKDKGLIIIGVHTPEFDFEKDYNNVKRAVEKFKIKYPVVQDNNFETWSAYGNQYWPRKYLIDIDGFIVYDHIGEGGYDEVEMKIQELLDERNNRLKLKENISKELAKPDITNTEFKNIGSPEIYFGYGFSRGQIGNSEGLHPDEIIDYKLPLKKENNKFYLSGKWLNNKDNMELKSDNGFIVLNYLAKNVNLVAGSKEPAEIKVFVDNSEVNRLNVSNFDLYPVVSMNNYGKHELRIESSKGLMAYTFTFG